MKVGFFGLGRMGRGMSRRILDGGHDLVVYDVTPDWNPVLGPLPDVPALIVAYGF